MTATTVSPTHPLPAFGAIGLLLLVSLGCVSARMYRQENLEAEGAYSLAFIELDDQGELWSSNQLATSLEHIGQQAAGENGAIVVVFVHGWDHNASLREERIRGGNVRGFRAILDLIARDEELQEPASRRPVVGVYLGWRGKSIRTTALLPFSFFHRLAAAVRVASPSTTEVIYRLSSTAKANPNSRVVFLGHSMGGLILERALSQALIGSVLGASRRNEPLPADVVLLLNPASQSLWAKQFIEALGRDKIKVYRQEPGGERYERPLVVSVTSQGDLATRVLFPISFSFRSLTKSFRRYSQDPCTPGGRQRGYYTRTAGNNEVLLSHVVTAEPSAGESQDSIPDRFGGVSTRFDPITNQRAFTFLGEGQTRFTIGRRPRALNESPYWIMQVPRELIPSHSKIFRQNTVRLVGAILAISGSLARDSETAVVRDRGLHPIELVARSAGGLIILDQDRRVYVVNGDSDPVSPGCIPQVVDAADRIGLEFDERGGHAVTNERAREGKGKFKTELLDIDLLATGPVIAQRTRLEGSRRFVDAAFDFSNERLFLASSQPGEIYVADLRRRGSEPRLLLRIEGSGPVGALGYQPSQERLFAADGTNGRLFVVDLTGPEPKATFQVGQLGWPVDLAIDGERSVVYIVDVKNHSVWSTQCPEVPDEARRCGAAREFLPPDLLGAPSFVTVGSGGVVWLAGREDKRIVRLSAEGQLERIIGD